MTQPQEVIDLTENFVEPSRLETSSSRKHDRHEEDPQVEGPSKYAKLDRNSEPPKRKDTSTTPRRKQKKSGKTINLHKASRASTHSELKAKVKTLERNLRDTQKMVNVTKLALKDREQDLQRNTSELKRVRKVCDEKSEEVRTQKLKNEAGSEEHQSLKVLVDDPVNGIQALQESCRSKDDELNLKDGKIISLQQEIDEVKKRLDKTEQEVEAVRTTNDTNSSWNEKLKQRERKAKDTLKTERDEHKNKIWAFETEKFKLQQRCEELEKNLKTQENQNNEMITNLQQEIQASRPQNQRFNLKVPDDTVQHDFAALESKIRQFVYKHTQPVLNATDQELHRVWPSWSPALRNFLASPVLCNLAIEGCVWERLLASVFTPWSEVWAGELGQSLEKVLSMASAESEQAGFESETYMHYQYLRSSSSSFICRLNGEDFRPEDFDSAVNFLVSTLKKLCGLHEVTNSMKADAIGIFKHARDFEMQLRKLKAVYTFHMCKLVPGGKTFKYGMFFDDNGMTDRSPCPSDTKHDRVPAVDFIMSPGLHKRGNSDGDMYNHDTWLVKMGVVCDAARFFMKSDHSNTAGPDPAQTPKAPQSGQAKQKDKDQGSHHAAQMQTGTATNMMTRRRTSSKTGSNVHDGKSNTESTNNHSYSMGGAKGRGGESSAKRTRRSRRDDPDLDYHQGSNI